MPTGSPSFPHIAVENLSFLEPGKTGRVGSTRKRSKKRPQPWQSDGSMIWYLLQKQLLSDQQLPDFTTTTTTATVPISFTAPVQTRPPTHVQVLILTWETTGLADTDRLCTTLKQRGYQVQRRTIPCDYPTAAVETILHRFLSEEASSSFPRRASPVLPAKGDSLLIVYYRGWGCLDAEGRTAFFRCVLLCAFNPTPHTAAREASG